MKTQEIFDIAYTVNLSGLKNEQLLTRTFFMRTGINLPHSRILEMYQEILRVVNSMGYSDPMDFLQDYFPNEDFRKVRIFRKNLALKVKLERAETPVPEEQILKTEFTAFPNTAEEPKRVRTQSPGVEKEVVLKPIKIKREMFQGGCLVEISQKERSKILKYKKSSKRFKEMEPREKEIDNKYDYFVHRARLEEEPRGMVDSRDLLQENPFVGQFFGDLDMKFREVMFKIYKYNRSQIKDKSRMTQEMDFLEEYFCEKLQMSKGEEDSAKKLSNAIAYLMKKLQNKIFESDEEEVIEAMLYFKARLSSFYNYYRK